MNLTAKRNNLNLYFFFLKAWLFAGLFAFWSCSGRPINNLLVSGIDARFQLMQKNSSTTYHNPASSSVRFYQNVIRSTLGSHCAYFPSDSAHAVWMSKNCNPLKSTLNSFARYSREFDVAFLGLPIIHSSQNQNFKDIPNGCNWIE